TFKGEFDHQHHPLIYEGKQIKQVILKDGKQTVVDFTVDESQKIFQKNIKRMDLRKKVYPYAWIQGQFNFDKKTDLALISLYDESIYFLNTRTDSNIETGGTKEPDILIKVENGIGGIYKMRYAYSNMFDHTGEDDTHDLPFNRLLCSQLELLDYRSPRIRVKYKYEGGYLFSKFINGRKETDFFGFKKFETIDTFDTRIINTYYQMPYDDFRENRALGGAIKQTLTRGWDERKLRDLSTTDYDYQLFAIKASQDQPSSYLVVPQKVTQYSWDKNKKTLIPVSQTDTKMNLVPGKYELASKSITVTDLYADDIHSPTSITTDYFFETQVLSNQRQLHTQKDFSGTAHETCTFFQYNELGLVVQQRRSYTGSGLEAVSDRIQKTEYDGFGNPIKVTNNSDSPYRIQEYVYDSVLFQYLTEERQITDKGYLSTAYSINYKNAFGDINIITNANQSNYYFTYDEFGRLIKEEADIEAGRILLSEYSYQIHTKNMWGTRRPISSKTLQHASPSEAPFETRVYFDGLGREIHTVKSALNKPGKRYTRSGRIEYNGQGRVKQKSQTDWAEDQEIDTFIRNKTSKNPTSYTYDALGRTIRIVYPQAYRGEPETSVSTTYVSPWETVSVHSIGQGKRTIKNARGQVLYVEDFGKGEDDRVISAKMGFGYDLTGLRIKKMDLNDTQMSLDIPEQAFQLDFKDTSGFNIAYWKTDGLGQILATSDPDRGVSTMTYNGFGDLISTTDALNQTTKMFYDRLGRLTWKDLPEKGKHVDYIYDEYEGAQNAKGRLAMLLDPVQKKVFRYNELGQRIYEKRTHRHLKLIGESDGPDFDPEGMPEPFGPQLSKFAKLVYPDGFNPAFTLNQYETWFFYDWLDRTRQISYPKDPITQKRIDVIYVYNRMGLVDRVYAKLNDLKKEIVKSVSYNEFGQKTTITHGNDITNLYEYDKKGRLFRLISTSDPEDPHRRIQNVEYIFNINNNIKKVISRPTQTVSNTPATVTEYAYQYDGLNRLITANGHHQTVDTHEKGPPKKFKRAYQYALNGNLTQKSEIDPDTQTVTDQWDYSYSNHAATSI
ncbi:MAG: hypothetical protein GY757_32950, partial [bacterium]|nr:hypothetical protein [bacterium]